MTPVIRIVAITTALIIIIIIITTIIIIINVDSINFVSTIGKKLTEVSGDSLETSYLFQKLSVAI